MMLRWPPWWAQIAAMASWLLIACGCAASQRAEFPAETVAPVAQQQGVGNVTVQSVLPYGVSAFLALVISGVLWLMDRQNRRSHERELKRLERNGRSQT